MMYTSKAVNLIKSFEGFSPQAYRDGDKKSIGYGTLIDSYEEAYLNFATINKTEAEKLLRNHLDGLQDHLNGKLKVSITQNQNDALMSFAYNVGIGGLNSIINKLNNGYTKEQVSSTMLLYTKQSGKELIGLVKRRKKEVDLFLTKDFSFLPLLFFLFAWLVLK